MSKQTTPKKAAAADMHRADIVAALHKRGWSLRSLAKHHNYKTPTALGNALDRKWPKGEKLIADAIGLPPEAIWPTRYVNSTAVFVHE
ncbi:transcriptional regulator [Chitinimonas sp.]|uniref:helix-turn-helix domain-containing protein n=1 Tax=Chitinimonas sp. TaxID=1934313 RepID=UPI0035B1A90E